MQNGCVWQTDGNLIKTSFLYTAEDRNRIIADGLQLQRLYDLHRKRRMLCTCVPGGDLGKELHGGQLTRLEISEDEGIGNDSLRLTFERLVLTVVFLLEVHSTMARFDVG